MIWAVYNKEVSNEQEKMSYSEDSLLIFGKRISSDELHDFRELIFLLEDLTDGFFESHELWVDFRVIFSKDSVVVGERNVPVDRGEMLTLSEFFVQTPEDLHDGKSGRCDWIGEVTTWG